MNKNITELKDYLPIQVAARFNMTDKLELLLGCGQDVNEMGTDHSTALHIAALFGALESAKILIKHKANIEIIDGQHHETPLLWAAVGGKKEIMNIKK